MVVLNRFQGACDLIAFLHDDFHRLGQAVDVPGRQVQADSCARKVRLVILPRIWFERQGFIAADDQELAFVPAQAADRKETIA